MKTEYRTLLGWMAFAVAGTALAILLLVGITGGFLFGTVALLVAVAALTSLAIANTIAARRAAKARETAPAALAPGVEAEKAPAPMVARITEARGACAMGYEHRPGETWDVNGKAEGAPALCPVFEAKLVEAGKRLAEARDGEETETVVCEAKDHKVVIELAKREREAANR